MDKDPTGATAPKGGFQQGGWYSGYQFYNGSFAPQAGQIHPQSTQQGAGKAVSPEVNRQTSIAAGLAPNANQDYVDMLNRRPAETATPAVAPVVPAGGAGVGTGVGAGGAGAGAGAGITGAGVVQPPDLTSLYNRAYESSGITELQKQYDEEARILTETKAKINDNPFLSEATRVGRVAKLEQLFQERTKNKLDEIATKKADIETKMNLELKQFDLNSQAAKDALARANTLLDMGILTNASGDDIANLTRMTGISSSAWYAAINASKAKNVKTSVEKFTADDGTVTAVVINAETGAIISKTDLGKIGNADNGTETATDLKISENDAIASVEVSIQDYIRSKQAQDYISPEDLYRELIKRFPQAVQYIKENWTATNIRKALGEKTPYS